MKIFDGYNVIGAAGAFGLDLAQSDKEERLLRLLLRYRTARGGRGRYLVVFDGTFGRLLQGPRKETRGGITVEWAVDESADSLIVRRLRRSRNPGQIDVVSSDREVRRQVALLGGRPVRSEEFLAAAKEALAGEPPLEKPENPTAREVKEWLDLFGEGE